MRVNASVFLYFCNMENSVDIDGLNLHYKKSGSGPDLILMHGWGCSSATVESIARVASETNTVYNIDFPGFGETSEPPSVWGVEEYTQLIESFSDKLGIKIPVLIGHSFGGRIALLYSSRNPTSKVVLVDAAGLKPRRSIKYYIKTYSFKLSKRLLHLLYSKDSAERKIEELRKKHGSADYASASSTMRVILSKVVNEDLTHVLKQIVAPTLLIWGEKDTATPLWMAQKMERMIKDSGLVSFPNAGHYSFLDNQMQFAAVLRSFLKSN